MSLIILVKNTKTARIPLLTFKNTKIQTKKSQEEEMAVKEINIAFATSIPMLYD